MDIFEAIKSRRSCRNFLPDTIAESAVRQILEAANWAPSPANNQPWEFLIITNVKTKTRIAELSELTKKQLFEKSGWKWMEKYQVGFLRDVPLIIAVIGDPNMSGAGIFMKGGETSYQHACAAAIQNMLLAIHALDLGGLWFTLFEKDSLRDLLEIPSEKDPIALICVGKPLTKPLQTPRKDLDEKTSYFR